ncbi:MAG: hypothetical protein ITG02_09860 [Patulibacter sp.]|nr:hypothetical protein [Patulibacter sp.]
MRTKFRAAIASMLVAMVAAGAAVMPSAASAHAETGPLCYGNELYTYLSPAPGGMNGVMSLYYGEPFRIKQTIIFGGDFYSLGHSASSNQVDYWVYTPHLRCQ